MQTCYFPFPIIRKSHIFLLLPYCVNVCQGPFLRVSPVLYRSIFSRQPKCVIAHRIQDIVALHSLVTGQRITNGIIPEVAHMQPSAWIGIHLKAIELLLIRVFLCLEYSSLFPFLLPFLGNLIEIYFVIGHLHKFCYFIFKDYVETMLSLLHLTSQIVYQT